MKWHLNVNWKGNVQVCGMTYRHGSAVLPHCYQFSLQQVISLINVNFNNNYYNSIRSRAQVVGMSK